MEIIIALLLFCRRKFSMSFGLYALDHRSGVKIICSEPHIDVNSPNDAGDTALLLAERYCGLECMLSCRDNRM